MSCLQNGLFRYPISSFRSFLKAKTTPHVSKTAPLCRSFDNPKQGHFCPSYWGQKKLISRRAELAPRIVLYFTQRNSPILGAETNLFDLQCSYGGSGGKVGVKLKTNFQCEKPIRKANLYFVLLQDCSG